MLTYADALRDRSRHAHATSSLPVRAQALATTSTDAELCRMHGDARIASAVAAESSGFAQRAVDFASVHTAACLQYGRACRESLERVLQRPGRVASWEANGVYELLEAILSGAVKLEAEAPEDAPELLKGRYLSPDKRKLQRGELDWRTEGRDAVAAATARASREVEARRHRQRVVAAAARHVQGAYRRLLDRRRARAPPPKSIVI